ncbi:MAG: sigma-70 family RNA polymerase sigma factor [Bacteroidota bacterium]|nr:sigma-70 family RNA polymerase sigma factor [Bacteroidota bacterium]
MAPGTLYLKRTDLLENYEVLIRACINGDRNAQSKLHEQFAPKMLGVCMRYSKSREEAEEVMQQGFVQIFKSLGNFRYEGSFEGWVRRIMVYSAIRHYHSKPKMYPVVEIETSQAMEIGNEDILARIQIKELLKMVQDLSPRYRMVFNLYVFEGMKHREIAEQLGISEGTSKSNLFDAKRLLQKAIISSLKIANHY